MEAAAIKEISRLAIESEKANRIHADGPGQKPAILIGNAIVDTENLLAGRVRFRGHFSTPLPHAFAKYVNLAGAHGQSSVYIDPDKVTATAFLNEGNKSDPGHCDWTAKLALVATAGFSALLEINGKRQSQRDLSDWLEDWSAMLTPVFPGGEPSTLGRAIAAVRSLVIKAKDETAHVIHDMGARQSGLSQIEAASEAGDLPVGFEARVVPYQGLDSRPISLRLSVITGDKPALVLRIVGLEALKESIANEFRELVQDIVTMPVIVGTFRP